MNPTIKITLRMAFGLVGYGLAICIMNLFQSKGLAQPLNYTLLLLPIPPLIYCVANVIRSAALLDEMWRKLLTEAMAFSGLATGFTCFSYVFVRNIGMPPFQPEWAFYLMWFYYGIGALWLGRKY